MKIRKAEQSDIPKLEELIANDPYHRDLFNSEFFFRPDTTTWVVEDERGIIFFLRTSEIMRFHIQFDNEQRARNAKALLDILPAFLKMAQDTGHKQMIFDSTSPGLIKFATEKMGFTPSSEFVRNVEYKKAQ